MKSLPAQPSPSSPTYSGDCLDTIYDIVNGTLAAHGLKLERYPIDTIIDILASVPPAELPKCESCETAFALIPCKGCKAFYCSTCKSDHPCCQPDGPNLYDVTRG